MTHGANVELDLVDVLGLAVDLAPALKAFSIEVLLHLTSKIISMRSDTEITACACQNLDDPP